MSLVLDVVAWAALLAGGFFAVVSAVGLHRMPDFFTRTHAASVIDTLGVGFLTLGMLLQTEDWAVGVRLAIIMVVLYTTGAVAVHALARAALHDGERPLLAGTDGKLRATDVASLYPDLGARLAQPLISEQVEDRLPTSSMPPDARTGASEAEEAAGQAPGREGDQRPEADGRRTDEDRPAADATDAEDPEPTRPGAGRAGRNGEDPPWNS